MQLSSGPFRAAMTWFIQSLARPTWLAGWFLLCALPTGLGCALLAPLGLAPDEVPHIVRADALRLGQLTAIQAPGAYPQFEMNVSVFLVLVSKEVYAALDEQPVPPAAVAQARSIGWFGNNIACPSQMAEYFPVFYVPGAVGLGLGKIAGLSPLHAVYLGRVAMLLAYVALGSASLALARCGGALLFAVLTLPPSLEIGASYNQDGAMLACCALAAALLTRAGEKGALRRGCVWAALAAVATAKIPYAALLGLGLSPLSAPRLAGRAAVLAVVALMPLFWLVHLSHGGFVPYPRPPYHPGPLWPGARTIWLTDVRPQYNLQVLRKHPAAVLWLPAASVMAHWPAIWPYFFTLTAHNIHQLGGGDWPFMAAALAAALLGAAAVPPVVRAGDAGLVLLCLFGAFSMMELSLYLTFSLAGAARIDGVQARYFLPLLPFLILILPSVGAPLARLPRLGAALRLPAGLYALPAVAMAILHIYTLPALIFHTFQTGLP